MHFRFEQRWDFPPADVVEIYLDEGFWTGLEGLDKTAAPTVLAIDRRGDVATVQLHWILSVDLPAEAARFIDPDDVAWVETTEWDLRTLAAQVSFQPDQAAGLLRASAVAEVTPTDGGRGTLRSVQGDLKVRIPLLGRKVEPVIVDGVGDHLAEEAAAVGRRLVG